MCTVSSIICTSSLLSCIWGMFIVTTTLQFFIYFSALNFNWYSVVCRMCFLGISHTSFHLWSLKEGNKQYNCTLIKLVLSKIKIGRKTEGTRKTDTQATSRSHKVLERYVVGFTQSVHQGMRIRRGVSQVLAGRTSILLMSLYQSWCVLSPRQQKAFHLSDSRHDPEEGAAPGCP